MHRTADCKPIKRPLYAPISGHPSLDRASASATHWFCTGFVLASRAAWAAARRCIVPLICYLSSTWCGSVHIPASASVPLPDGCRPVSSVRLRVHACILLACYYAHSHVLPGANAYFCGLQALNVTDPVRFFQEPRARTPQLTCEPHQETRFRFDFSSALLLRSAFSFRKLRTSAHHRVASARLHFRGGSSTLRMIAARQPVCLLPTSTCFRSTFFFCRP